MVLSEIVARPTKDLTLNSCSRCRLDQVVSESRMGKLHAITFSFFLAGVVGCKDRQRTDVSVAGEHSPITFQVHGMMKAKSGAT